jgi:putative phage-type endonuclease
MIRSYPITYVYNKTHISEEYIQYLKNIPQPKQRTEEWYLFRYNHITASNGWKAYSNKESTINELIYEKCKPYEIKKDYSTSLSLSENAMTWGHKYEPLTSKIYEEIYNTKIEEFGCIPHNKYSFIAASPDGIVTGENNFGRMIEIKNVVSREISGIPKKDYYIQVQLQLEVCDLEECDFVETKFTEYTNYDEFINDGEDLFYNNENKRKGSIIVYIKNNSEFIYDYINTNNKEEFMYRINNKNETEEIKWYKDIFWKLETFSCVLIPRCKKWFDLTYPQMEKIWDIILKERQTGEYIKREPKRRKKVDTDKQTNCLVKII